MPILNHKLPMKHVKGTDTSASTVTESTMLNGFTSHDSNGNQITGTIMMYDGMVSGGLIIVPTEPTMYLYGHEATEGENADVTIDGVGYVGAVLPDINEVWDKEKYPYALICTFDMSIYGQSGYVHILATGDYKYQYNNGEFLYTYSGEIHDHVFLIAHDQESADSYTALIGVKINVGEWITESEQTHNGEGTTQRIMGVPFFANYDILTTDGTVYLAASEPIPVYE